jgi:hypothetical protein
MENNIEEYNIKLNIKELNLVLSALGELKANLSFDLINNIRKQYFEQSKSEA